MKIAFYTLGCKVNQCDTIKLKNIFELSGFEIVDFNEFADIYVVNSCTVTAVADKKTRQFVNRCRKINSNAVVCLIGCFPQAFPQLSKKLNADIVLGSKDKMDLPQKIDLYLNDNLIKSKTHKIDFENFRCSDRFYKTRAYIKIEDGCDRYCSYCIIPKARGPIKSKPFSDIKQEIKNLSDLGFAEIVLVGVNLSSYGKDLLNTKLLDVLNYIETVDNIKRVRLGSLEPDLLKTDDVKQIAQLHKLCPQFHLSLQSGSDNILNSMRRKYNTKSYVDLVGNIKKYVTNPSVTTDIIVGFPGETDNDVDKTLDLINNIAFLKVHVFPFSARPGTLAYNMKNQIPPNVKKERLKLIESASDTSRKKFFNTQKGKIQEVLVEKHVNNYLYGYSKNYLPVKIFSTENLSGKIKYVRIIDVEDDFCVGELLN